MPEQAKLPMYPGRLATALTVHRKSIARWIQFFVQTAIGYAVLTPVALIIFVTGSVYEGFQTLFALAFFLVLSPTASIGIAVIAGLPLRLIPSAERWWRKYSWLGVLGIILGACSLVASYLLGRDGPAVLDGVSFTMFFPDGPLLLAGWTMLAFFSTHTWFPRTVRNE